MEEWMKQMLNMHIIGIKRREILTHTTQWTKLEDIMQSEGNQSEKTTYYTIPFM